MGSAGAVLTGVSIACIVAGVALLAVQVRRRPQPAVPSPSGNGSSSSVPAATSRGGASRRRRVVYTLLAVMAVTLTAAIVVQERLVWGVHLLADNAFLGYVAWLVRRAETRAHTAEPQADGSVSGRVPAPSPDGEGKEEATDARA